MGCSAALGPRAAASTVAASFVRHDVTSEADWARAPPSFWAAALMETDMKAVVPAMERSGGRSIVNIAVAGGLARVLRLCRDQLGAAGHGSDRPRRPQNPGELVHPGPIDTNMIAFRTPEQREERIKQVPMHRHGAPEEVVRLVAFLLSDESSYITGAEIAIDGATSAKPQ